MHIRVLSGTLAALLAITLTGCSNPEADKKRYVESGDQFVAQKKYQEAIVEYRNAIRADNRFGEAHYKLAEAYTAVNDTRNAARQYILAADLMPDNVEAQLKATTMLTLGGRLEDAKTRVQKVLD